MTLVGSRPHYSCGRAGRRSGPHRCRATRDGGSSRPCCDGRHRRRDRRARGRRDRRSRPTGAPGSWRSTPPARSSSGRRRPGSSAHAAPSGPASRGGGTPDAVSSPATRPAWAASDWSCRHRSRGSAGGTSCRARTSHRSPATALRSSRTRCGRPSPSSVTRSGGTAASVRVGSANGRTPTTPDPVSRTRPAGSLVSSCRTSCRRGWTYPPAWMGPWWMKERCS